MKQAKTSSLTLGDFEVHSDPDGRPAVIGRGSFGVVYCALDRRTGVEVALKVLNEQVSSDEKAVARFKEETREHKRLNHPGIVTIQDSGDFGNQLYYSMEFCRGGDLAAYSKAQGPLEPIHALKIIQQVADALVYASGHYLLHRDIKPGNILLVSPPVPGQIPKVKLTDFGLSKISVDLDSIRRPQMSLLGGFHGTLQYASPEQVMEDPLDVRSDIFSLGLTLWHLLAGAYPLGSQKEHELINDRIDDRAYADRFPKDWPPAFASLLGRMLEKKPENRFRDFGELTRVLENCIESLADTNGGREVKPAKGRAAPLKEYFTQIDRKKKRPLGILHTARMLPTDGVGDPSPCHFLLLESSLDAGTMEALRTVVENITTNPHPNIAALDWQETLDGHALVIHSPPDGQTLLNTIRKEGKHALSSVHQLLEQAASANDHVRSLGVELNAHPRDVNLLFDFTGTRLLFTVSLPGDDAHDAGQAGGTIAGTMMGEGSAASGDSALMDFATLLYWMVSARMPVSAAYVNANAYKAIEGLGETGNSLIRDALCGRWTGSCLELFTSICREEGLPPPKTATNQAAPPAPSVSRPPSATATAPREAFVPPSKSEDPPAKPPSVLPVSQYPSRTGSLANSRVGNRFALQREQKQREIDEKQRQLEEERRKLEEEQEKAAEMEAYLQEVEQGLAEQHELERQQLEEAYQKQLREKENETNELRLAAERAQQEKDAEMEAYLQDFEQGLAEKLDLERQQLEATFQQQLRAKEEETDRLRLAAQRAEQERIEALRLAEQKEAERLAALENARSGNPLSPEDSESLKSAREETLRLRQEAEAERKAAAEKLRQAEEEAARKAEEAKRIAEEAAAEAKRLAEEEARKVREAAEAERLAAAEQLRLAREEAKRHAEEEARKVREAAEAERLAAAEQLRLAREEAERKAAEARQKAEKEAAEAKRRAEQEAAEKLRQAEKEAERKAAEARQKAEKEAAEAKRKAEAEAKALREQATKEKERAKKEAEEILAAAREGKSKPFLPLPVLVGLALVLLVGGFFAVQSLPMFQGAKAEAALVIPPPKPVVPPDLTPPPIPPVPPPPIAPAPKTWYSTWKLVGSVGKVEVIQPEGAELKRDDQVEMEVKDGEDRPSAITFKDEAGEFTLAVKTNEWREQKGSSAEVKKALPNIEFMVEAPNLPEMIKELGACALLLADKKGIPTDPIPIEGKGKVECRIKPGEYTLGLAFERIRFNGSPRLEFVNFAESADLDQAPGVVPSLLKAREALTSQFELKIPNLLETREITLSENRQYRLICMNSENLPQKFGDEELSLDFDVGWEKALIVGRIGKDGTKFSAEIRDKRPDDLDLVEAATASLRNKILNTNKNWSLKFGEHYGETKANFEEAMNDGKFADAKSSAKDMMLMELEMFRNGMEQIWKGKGENETIIPHNIQMDPRTGVLHYSTEGPDSRDQSSIGSILLWESGEGKFKVFNPRPIEVSVPGMNTLDPATGKRIYMARLAPSEEKRKTQIFETKKTKHISTARESAVRQSSNNP